MRFAPMFLSVALITIFLSSFAAAVTTFTLSSAAFNSGETIPLQYTHNLPGCPAGQNVNPPFKITGAPDDVGSYVLIMDDLDNPTVHWVVWNIPASLRVIPQNWNAAEAGVSQGINDFTTPGMEMFETGYAGMCPPAGERHRYRFQLYALAETFIEDGLPTAVGGDADNIVTIAEFEAARSRNVFTVLADTALIGWYPDESGPRCGNGVVEAGEECEEDVALSGTCMNVPGGFTGGRLRCTIANCRYDTSGCTADIVPRSVVLGGTCASDSQCIEGLSCILAECRNVTGLLDIIRGIVEDETLSRRQVVVRIARALKDFLS